MNSFRRVAALVASAALMIGMTVVAMPSASADTTELTQPVRARVLPDGRVLVVEKAGIVKLAPSVNSPAGTILDIREQVASYEDHGLTTLGYQDGYMYLGYTARPPAGQVGSNNDCPNFTIESGGCPTTAHLSRFSLSSTGDVGPEQRLFGGIPQICILYTTHGLDDLEFGPDGRLYFSVGDGAGFTGIDVGQGPNADFCGADEGSQKGALRAQTDYNLNGKVVSANPDGTDMRVEAKGLRNPFSMAFDDAGDLWIGDTGWSTFEEINRMTPGGAVENFGWPCYEGPGQNQPSDILSYTQQPVCQQLIASGSVVNPVKAYEHPDTAGATGKFASISALAPHDGRIYFGDYSQTTLASVLPDGSDTRVHASGVFPVDLTPVAGDLWMVDIAAGTFAPAPIDQVVEPPDGDPYAMVFGPRAVTPGAFETFSVQSNLIPERQTGYTVLWTAQWCDGATGSCVERYFTDKLAVVTQSQIPAAFDADDTFTVTVHVSNGGLTTTGSTTFTLGGATEPTDPGTAPAARGDVRGLISAFDTSARTFTVDGAVYSYDEDDFFRLNGGGEWIVNWERALCLSCTIVGDPYAPGGVSDWDLVTVVPDPVDPVEPGEAHPDPTDPTTPVDGSFTAVLEEIDTRAGTLTLAGTTYPYDTGDFFRLSGRGEWIVNWERAVVVGGTLRATYVAGGQSEWDFYPADEVPDPTEPAGPAEPTGPTGPAAPAGAVTGVVETYDTSARTVQIAGVTYAYDEGDYFALDDRGEWIVKWERALRVGGAIEISPYLPGGTSEWNLLP